MNIAKPLIVRVSPIVALFALGTSLEIASGQTEEANASVANFTTLYSFSGPDGASPAVAALVQATSGDFFGTTSLGGANCSANAPCGTIFKITPSGALTTLYSFCAQTGCADGGHPAVGLVQATNGDFYGTTLNGPGRVFKTTPSGTLTTVYTFCSQPGCVDGVAPFAGLIQTANGDLYGQTTGGGLLSSGTIFNIAPSGTLTTLYSFNGSANPYTKLVQATNGDLYGTASAGGAFGKGMVFKMTPTGTLTTLHSFCSQTNCTDGQSPYAWLVQGTNGDLYGATAYGGVANCAPNGCGTIFKITPKGTLTTLYSFCSQPGCTDGEVPVVGLVQSASGNLYGTTSGGGAHGGGTIFKIVPSGALRTVYNFCSRPGCNDGQTPTGLIQGTNGIIYGATEVGGTSGNGTLFSLSTGEPPFVETRPTIAKVGERVTIIGYKLTGATNVTFNGTPVHAFTVEGTVIVTRVPVGATTGKVQVVTPSGTLTSNVAFEVVP